MDGCAAALGARWAGLVLVGALSGFVVGCARGYGPVESSSDSLSGAGVGAGAGAGGAAGMSGGGGAGGSAGGAAGAGGASMPTGAPCAQAQVEMCTCANGTSQGMHTCIFDASSPLDGFFAMECKGCPPPSPKDKCGDGMKDISESDADCGGPDCDPCELGDACLADRDCSTKHCVSFKCSMTGAAGAGGSGAAGSGGSGAAGSGGSGAAGSGGCMCTGLLSCCRFDGSCGTGVAPICI